MVTYSLDGIVRSFLIKKNYPIHFYMNGLVYAASCLRELTIDDLKIINTKLIPVDTTTSEAKLPDDYVNYVEVGMQIGQKVRPLVEDKNLSSIAVYNSNYSNATLMQPLPASQSQPILIYNYLLPLFWLTTTYNQYGENIGRLFGWGNGDACDTFKIVKERNVIKINENLTIQGGNIVMIYVSDGQSVDAISQIPAEAFDTITKYIGWQFKENNRSYSEGEKERAKQQYLDARGILRARLNDITPEVMLRIMQKNYKASSRS